MKEKQHNRVLLSWKTPNFIPLPRGIRWYLTAGLIFGLLILYAAMSRSLTMLLVFVLFSAVFMISHRQTPHMTEVKISDLGIEYDGQFYAYHMIRAFWMVYHPPYVRSLYLKLGGKHPRLIKIELNHQSPVPLRKLLTREIPEIEGAGEPFFDLVSRLLRFQ